MLKQRIKMFLTEFKSSELSQITLLVLVNGVSIKPLRKMITRVNLAHATKKKNQWNSNDMFTSHSLFS